MKSFKTGFLLALLCLLVVSGSVFAMEEVIAETKIPLIGDRISVRTQETNLGNLVCDAILSMTGAILPSTMEEEFATPRISVQLPSNKP